MNYTKYALKCTDELTALLEGKDKLFVMACNKCFKEFDTTDEPEIAEFVKMAEGLGKTITGTAKIDFLCNSTQTERKLTDLIPEGTENIIVISCGLGVQTVAGMEKLPVFTATDSLNYIGHHGMALTQKTCGACAQCYLNLTGGICPIVDCSKSLINGQCGGAKDGKCEVDPKKDCAWQKIYDRLEKQGRQAEFEKQPVQIRDYSKADEKEVRAAVAKIRESRLNGYYGGVHPVERKFFTEKIELEKFPEPETVIIPTSMHAGAPATPIVAAGDHVNVGQKIAEASAFVSCNVHSSVSGTVVAIEPHMHPNKGVPVDSIVIRSDGKNTIDESVKPAGSLEDLTPEEIVEIVKEKGITGMGGAGFPAWIKFKPNKPVDTILLNGCECEPVLTADHRMMLSYADEIIFGLRAIMKAVGAPRGVIAIEENKPDAVALMTERAAGIPGVEVMALKVKYPQGAEKMLIKNILHRMVPSGGLPADVGAVVANVSSAKAISDAIQTGMPLVERAVSVSGEYMGRPGNYMVKIGTNVQDIIDYCGGITGEDVTIKMGGPMMGGVLKDTEVPIIKGSNGIIAIETDHTEEMECIRCGRCQDVCPMELSPLNFVKIAQEGDAQKMADEHVMDCFECRCCEYICSSKIPITNYIRNGKGMVRGLKK